MSYDWLGTFNTSQFESLLAFVRSQLVYVAARKRYLNAEINRIGKIQFKYSEGTPEGYTATPSGSYLAKLLAAYEVLGGDPFKHLRVRLTSQPVVILQGDENTPAQFTSSGEVVGAKGLMDGPTAELTRNLRGWVDETIQYRFNKLERKIRRAVDYSDQLQQEVAKLNQIQATSDVSGSLEDIAAQIRDYLEDTGYRAVYNDAGADPLGLKTYAPFSSYDGGPPSDPNSDVRRTRVTGQREDGGYRGPGDST